VNSILRKILFVLLVSNFIFCFQPVFSEDNCHENNIYECDDSQNRVDCVNGFRDSAAGGTTPPMDESLMVMESPFLGPVELAHCTSSSSSGGCSIDPLGNLAPPNSIPRTKVTFTNYPNLQEKNILRDEVIGCVDVPPSLSMVINSMTISQISPEARLFLRSLYTSLYSQFESVTLTGYNTNLALSVIESHQQVLRQILFSRGRRARGYPKSLIRVIHNNLESSKTYLANCDVRTGADYLFSVIYYQLMPILNRDATTCPGG